MHIRLCGEEAQVHTRLCGEEAQVDTRLCGEKAQVHTRLCGVEAQVLTRLCGEIGPHWKNTSDRRAHWPFPIGKKHRRAPGPSEMEKYK